MDLKGFVMDHMGYFAVEDLPAVLFSVVVAALLGVLIGRPGPVASARELAVVSALAALALLLVRGQLAVAVALLAVVLAVRPSMAASEDGPRWTAAAVLGAMCGSGATLVAVVAAVPILLLLRWRGPSATQR